MKQIKVSDPVYEQLAALKEDEAHTSFDSAVRALLNDHETPEWPFAVPDHRSLSEAQANAIIDVWGNQAIDRDGERGTATITTPPMTVEQIAVITLNAALSGKPVGAYTYCAAVSGDYALSPRLDDPEFNADDYHDRIDQLEGIVADD